MVLKYCLEQVVHIRGIDHPESIGVGPDGVAFSTGTGCQVYRLNLEEDSFSQIASTEGRCLGSAVDADGNLYLGHTAGNVLKIDIEGKQTIYATGPDGQNFECANYPTFDRQGHLYLSDSGDWSNSVNGHIYRIPPGGGEARLWFSEPVNTPNAVALDAEENYLYFVETFASSVSRIRIEEDGSAGQLERVVHMPHHVPDGIAFDESGRLWIACHRPDRICVLDLVADQLEVFADDWRGHYLRGPTDVAFAGENRDILLASSLDNLVIHRFPGVDVRGLKLNYPKLNL